MKTSNIEIERKFLVPHFDIESIQKTDPKLSYQYLRDISQYYLLSNELSSVRVRTYTKGMDSVFLMTIKEKVEGSFSNKETEFPISKTTFLELKKQAISKISKIRYVFEDKETGLLWEIDNFQKSKKGSFIMAEVELPAENYPYETPTFIGQEVTNNPEYHNQNLALKI